jgi:DNA polymerase alpha subunit B
LLLLLLLVLLLQVVAVKGVSPNGSRILAKHIWTHLPPPCPHTSSAAASAGGAADAMEVDCLGSDAGLSAVVAAGPYCLADDLAFDPLHEMLQELKGNPPHMLVSCDDAACIEQPCMQSSGVSACFCAQGQHATHAGEQRDSQHDFSA